MNVFIPKPYEKDTHKTAMAIVNERQDFLAAWRYRDYRLLWGCTLGIYIGHWIEAVVVSWLVLELTNSPFLVGLVGACRFIAMFLGPFCGTISDRHDRRRILIVVQLFLAATSLIMMGLILTSRLAAWHLFVFALVGSVGFTLNFSRHSEKSFTSFINFKKSSLFIPISSHFVGKLKNASPCANFTLSGYTTTNPSLVIFLGSPFSGNSKA